MEHFDLEHRVDSLFEEWDKPGSPGASVLVLKDGEIVFEKGYGYANLEYDVPIGPGTIFHVASVSKQFTAMAIALLAQEGKVDLDDPVQKYVGDLHEFEYPVTLRHLIHHTSGIRDQWELLTLAGWRMDDVITLEHLMRIITGQRKLNFKPGTRYLYSNSGYTLLARVVEEASGKSFPDFVGERIFAPLGMENSHIHGDHQRIVKNRAYSYSPEGEGFKKSVLSYANYGATSLFTTCRDLAKWMMNFKTARVGGHEVISLMQEPYILSGGETTNYGFGLMIRDYRGLRHISHGGSDAGFRSHFGFFPERDLGIIILSNLGSFVPARMASAIADTFIETEKWEAEAAAASDVKDPKLIRFEDCCGAYLVRSAGKVANITLTDGTLSLCVEGWEKPLPLLPENPLETKDCFAPDVRFATKRGEATGVTFTLRAGKVVFMSLTLNGRQAGGAKVEFHPLTESQLVEYCGDYYSEELDTLYRLRVVRGGLVAKHPRHSDAGLIPVGDDTFLAKSGRLSRLSFARDEGGEVIAFSHTGGRVMDLEFVKYK